MAEPDDRNLEDRVTDLERTYVQLGHEVTRDRLVRDARRMAAAEARQDAAAARILAAAADQDVRDMRELLLGHTETLNALRADQLEHADAFRKFRAETESFQTEKRAGIAHITMLLEGGSGAAAE